MLTRRNRQATALVAGLALLAAASAGAKVSGKRETRIVSPPAGRASADGASDNPTFSQDQRIVRLMAFDSRAANLLPGDANGRRDVFLLRRTPRLGALDGSLSIVSVSTSGVQANGDSSNPSLDGDYRRAPRCVAFESTATNLAPADTEPDSDVFVRDLERRRTELVSVGERDARNGVVDGECDFVTFEAAGKVLVRDLEGGRTTRIATGTNPDQQTDGQGAAYERGAQIHYQAYAKLFNRGNPIVKKVGREVLVSAGRRGRGNGVSRNPVLDDQGWYAAFESTATNLCAGLCKGVSKDRNGAQSDVFRRTLSRRAPTRDRMQMVSFSFGVRAQGNGPSSNPAMSGAGEFVVFDSEATNLRPSRAIRKADPNGRVRDIYLWNFPRGRKFGNVSRESRPGPKGEFNGASVTPATSSRGNYIAFVSAQTGAAGERNGPEIVDMFMRFLGGK